MIMNLTKQELAAVCAGLKLLQLHDRDEDGLLLGGKMDWAVSYFFTQHERSVETLSQESVTELLEKLDRGLVHEQS